ncbi:hypothetical protein ACIBG0_41615 [Nocardia sp. NPDC050630]|uniref:hypothetical protein n=1 Tax=Nocardia sp. NPDC050630 TaxID=3364321 RepID=UPI00379795C3
MLGRRHEIPWGKWLFGGRSTIVSVILCRRSVGRIDRARGEISAHFAEIHGASVSVAMTEWLWRTFGADVLLDQENAAAKKVEVGSAEHLPLQHFKSYVESGPGVIMSSRGDHGLWRQSGGAVALVE